MISRVLTPLPPWISLQSRPASLEIADAVGDEMRLIDRHRDRIDDAAGLGFGATRCRRRARARRPR